MRAVFRLGRRIQYNQVQVMKPTHTQAAVLLTISITTWGHGKNSPLLPVPVIALRVIRVAVTVQAPTVRAVAQFRVRIRAAVTQAPVVRYLLRTAVAVRPIAVLLTAQVRIRVPAIARPVVRYRVRIRAARIVHRLIVRPVTQVPVLRCPARIQAVHIRAAAARYHPVTQAVRIPVRAILHRRIQARPVPYRPAIRAVATAVRRTAQVRIRVLPVQCRRVTALTVVRKLRYRVRTQVHLTAVRAIHHPALRYRVAIAALRIRVPATARPVIHRPAVRYRRRTQAQAIRVRVTQAAVTVHPAAR